MAAQDRGGDVRAGRIGGLVIAADSGWAMAKRQGLAGRETIITAEDLLNMMVNREGARSELNEMVRRNPGGPMDIKMGDTRGEKYRKANIVEFDGISYVQIFAFLTGHYLAKMMRATLRHLPEDLTRGYQAADLWGTIINMPPHFPPIRMYLDRPEMMGAIYQYKTKAFN